MRKEEKNSCEFESHVPGSYSFAYNVGIMGLLGKFEAAFFCDDLRAKFWTFGFLRNHIAELY